MRRIRHAAERLFLLALRAVPVRVAAHCLHVLRQDSALADRWGYHIRPIHYSEPLPDFRMITAAQLKLRRTPRGMPIDMPSQMRRVEDLAGRFGEEVRALDASGGFPFDNEYFAGLDAAVYYALIRDLKPARIVEIGAGYSTRIASMALETNRREGRAGTLTVIEPFPQPRLTEASVEMQLIVQPVEKVDPAMFRSLEANDILFIDSSHVLRLGGDVFFEFLEILPQLNPGVWVHVHDIFFPFDYPAEWVIEKRLAFNEQYLLEAFLAFNDRFMPELANCWLTTDHPGAVAKLLADRVVRDGSARAASFWMRRR